MSTEKKKEIAKAVSNMTYEEQFAVAEAISTVVLQTVLTERKLFRKGEKHGVKNSFA